MDSPLLAEVLLPVAIATIMCSLGLALTPAGQRIPVSGRTTAAPTSQSEGTNPSPGPGPGEIWVELNEQGFYEIRDTSGGDATAVPVAVNVDTTESDLMPLDPQELVAAVTGRARASDPEAAAEAAELKPADLERREPAEQRHRSRYFDADSAAPTAAWPAASLAVSTRKGEQLT